MTHLKRFTVSALGLFGIWAILHGAPATNDAVKDTMTDIDAQGLRVADACVLTDSDGVDWATPEDEYDTVLFSGCGGFF